MAAKTVFVYPLTGGRDFPIPFEYLARKFIQVTLKGGAGQLKLTLNTDYRFTTKTQITTTQAWSPTSDYDTIEIRRYTSATERLVDFNDGSILRAYDLNLSQIQTLHVAEEARDLTADTIGVNGDGDLDARNRKIVNVARGINNADAMNVGQLREFDTSTGFNADRAVAAADRADQSRDQAGQSAINASVSESVAVASASTATVAAGNAQASAADAEDSKDIVVPLVPIVELAAQQAAQASADALKASQAAAQAVIDVKNLGAVPIGSIVLFHSEKLPAGYLKLDGSTFDAALYPDLVTYLGSNVLPNWTDRHVKMVGTDLTAGETKEWETPAHSHDRGDMDITGRISLHGGEAPSIISGVTGAFSGLWQDGYRSLYSLPESPNSMSLGFADFTASRSWTGRTSTEGNSDKVETRRIGGVYAMKAAGVVADEGLAQLDGVIIELAAVRKLAEDALPKTGGLIDGRLEVYSTSTTWEGTPTKGIAGVGNIAGVAGEWFPLISSPTYLEAGVGYTNRWSLGHFRDGGDNNGSFVIAQTGDGPLVTPLRFHFNVVGMEIIGAGSKGGTFGNNGDVLGHVWGGGWLSQWLSDRGVNNLQAVGSGVKILAPNSPRVVYHDSHTGHAAITYIATNASFNIGTSDGEGDVNYRAQFQSNGNMQLSNGGYAASGFHTGSDIRLKDNIEKVGGLDDLATLRGVKWDWNWREGGKSAGLIAQEIQKVLPESVTPMEAEGGILSVNYNGVIALLVNAVNELTDKVKELEAKLK